MGHDCYELYVSVNFSLIGSLSDKTARFSCLQCLHDKQQRRAGLIQLHRCGVCIEIKAATVHCYRLVSTFYNDNNTSSTFNSILTINSVYLYCHL